MADARDRLIDEDDGTGLHRIVIVGGGAGGLELATRLGDKLGKRRNAHVTLIEKGKIGNPFRRHTILSSYRVVYAA